MVTENQLLIVALAEAFDHLLRTEIGKAKYREVLARNAAEPDAGICHSHDFCDANMMMDGAFRVVLQRGPDIDDDADLTLWTDAWNLWVEQTAPTRGRVQPPPTSLSTPADDASASERERVRVEAASRITIICGSCETEWSGDRTASRTCPACGNNGDIESHVVRIES